MTTNSQTKKGLKQVLKEEQHAKIVGDLPKSEPIIDGPHTALTTAVAQGKKKVYA